MSTLANRGVALSEAIDAVLAVKGSAGLPLDDLIAIAESMTITKKRRREPSHQPK